MSKKRYQEVDGVDARCLATWLHEHQSLRTIASRLDQGLIPPPLSPCAQAALTARGLSVWSPESGGFPPVLIIRGRAPVQPGVAIVGARAADPYGLSCARRVAEDTVRHGRSVVSGGAEGCDAAAHREALAHGGHTTVVLGAGHDHPYPAYHRALFDEVVEKGGCVVSPFWPTTPPSRHRFLLRNRVIAALAAATVVVRAGPRSGALSTARAARSFGRPLLAVPGDVGQGLSVGAHTLLSQGALPLTSPACLGRVLGQKANWSWPVRHGGNGDPWFGLARDPPVKNATLSEGARRLLAIAQPGALLHVDELVSQIGLPVDQVLPATLELELAGRIVRHPGHRICFVDSP